MRQGQILNRETLRDEAARAVRLYMAETGKTQEQVAEELSVSPSYLSRAINSDRPNVTKLQQRVVEKLTPYRLREVGGFLVERKENEASEG